jgi:hypothetical protein
VAGEEYPFCCESNKTVSSVSCAAVMSSEEEKSRLWIVVGAVIAMCAIRGKMYMRKVKQEQ